MLTIAKQLVHVLRMIDAKKKLALGFIYDKMDGAK